MRVLNEPRVESETEISEKEISDFVLQAQGNDPEAFARAFCLLQPRLLRQALFLAGDEHRALDLLQDTMLETWKHLQRFDGRARFFTWICGIMVHRHYDWLRRLRIRAAHLFEEESRLESEPEHQPGPSETSDHLDRARVMRECLDQLPSKQRAVVYLRFYAGESLEGIALINQCSVGTVKSRLFHALERLAKMQKLKEFQSEAPRSKI